MTDQSRWNAVTRRDAAADGRFVFAVRTTGIYCRPSCPARRPLRRNVEFFPLPEAAEAAGYRACRRCRPEAAPGDRKVALVRAACRHFDRATASVPAVAQAVGCSPAHLRRAFRSVLGLSPRQYGAARRAGRVRHELRTGASITSAQYAAGLSSSSRLYEASDERLGMTPGRFRDGGRGITIRYGFGRVSLGQVLVAATERGICAVRLGDRRPELESDLRSEFPKAELRREPDAVDLALTSIIEAIDRGKPVPALPLDVQATAFQARVWRYLQTIPPGETRSYLDVARAVGRPRSVRAVANACASNPVAVAVPCHRVVRADGGLGGYRWGEERKRVLLEREAG